MKKIFALLLIVAAGFSASAQQHMTKSAYISFFSEMESITAENFSVLSKLNTETGDLMFSVAIQSFQFKNATMQKHFNQEDVMNSKEFPKAKFIGKIENNEKVDYKKDGEYKVTVSGKLTIKGTTNDITTNGIIKVKEGVIHANATFELDRFEYGVTGKKKSVSQILKLTVKAKYE